VSVTTVLFDVGGTLLHFDYFFLRRELRRVGVRVTTRAIRFAEYAAKAETDRRLLGPSQETDETRRRPYFAVLLDRLAVEPSAAAQVIERIDAAHARDNLWRLMLPSTPRLLAGLRDRGFTLGVISNADGRVTTLLRDRGIDAFFRVVMDSHHEGVEKPDPRIFRLALERAGARPEQAVFVGDIYAIDVVGAQRAGLRPFLLDALGGYDGVRCEKIRHLRELAAIL
jgi:putative hydrolase of the HAD superfamily